MPLPSRQRLTRTMPAGVSPGTRILTVRVLLALGSLLAALMWPVASAVADDQQQVKLSLKPVDQAGSYFALTMEPGQSRELKVELGNHGTSPIGARTYAADAYSIINGGFGAKDRDSNPSGTTSWLSYPGQVLQLPAGQASIRSFTVTVPPGTAPGDYISSLILENDAPIQGSGSVALNQIVRQAVAVSIRVPGPLQPAFGFGHAEHKITAEHSVLDIGIANTGNINLKPAGNLTIHDHDGKTVAEAPVTLDSIYAHSETKVETTLGGKLQPGNYTVNISLTDPATKTTATGTELPFTVADPALANTGNSAQPGQLPQIIQNAGTGATPYLIGAGILVALAAVFLLIRRKRHPRPRRSDEATSARRRARRSRPAEHARRD
ncbi:WxL protein peptidoglycan domain-containing protein [Arthrobacter sp. SLBN-112]|uniref:WxL protein peptidoglycan domain-containing protein n=1 Tax=Arthrobacter sp. SLBN-112 TaxID=2768452 RepID=UPI0027B58901|nr:DUF916 domain-containing protein [Arthrobacter sp. SLBN-112]MDQ0800095.1 hypothetical protein [Arthrobacter sp. SLBN-112]